MDILTYQQALPIIEDGDIIFFTGNTSFIKHPLDAIIMLATGSPFVHCNIAFWQTIGGVRTLLAIEAQGGTTRRIISEDHYKARGIVVVKAIKPIESFAFSALNRVGDERYGYFTAFYAGVRDFFSRTFGWKIPKMSNPGEICSEFVAEMEGLEDTGLSPGDLFMVLSAQSMVKTPTK